MSFTPDILPLLAARCAPLVRDFHRVYPGDEAVRREKNYKGTEEAVVSGGLVWFRSACGCQWKSAHCNFKFHYDVFEFDGKEYLYLEVKALLQMCRRHKAEA